MVDTESRTLQWPSSCPPISRYDDIYDASKTGWGATDQQISTRGVWTKPEQQERINVLEMKAVQLAPQALVPSKRKVHIQLLIDNSTTIAYLNHKGGMHSKSLCTLALEIWAWCL